MGLVWLVRLIAAHLGSRQASSSTRGAAAAHLAHPAANSGTTSGQPAPSPDGGPAHPIRFGCLVFLLAVAGGALSVSFYNWLTHDYPSVNLRASSKNPGAIQRLSMEATKRGDRVRWLVSASYVGRLVVSGPDSGMAEIILPLPRSQCPKMATALGGGCSPSGELSVGSPVTFAWSNPQLINSTGDRQVASIGVSIASSGGTPGAGSATLLAHTNALPSLCFSSPFQIQPVTLTVTSLQGPYSHPFKASSSGSGLINCPHGLPVLVGSTGSGFPPALQFQQIRSLTIHAWASAGTLQGFAGEIDLDPGSPTVLGNPTIVSLRSGKKPPLVASLRVNPSGPTLAVRSKAATSVITNSGQLVPSAWARNTDFLVPVIGGMVSLLIISPLSASMQVLIDALKRCRGPRQWWRDRKARKRREKDQKKEVRHAT